MFSILEPKKIYTYQELLTLLQSTKKRSVSSCRQIIGNAIKDGSIVRMTRGKYMLKVDSYPTYAYTLSSSSQKLKRVIKKVYPDVDFVIFELTQLNEFLNHQIGKNMIFLYIEKELMPFVFDALKGKFTSVMLNPTEELMHRYLDDNMIIIKPLITRTPKCKDNVACLEKILVDLTADKTIGDFVEQDELRNLYSDMTSRYFIDKAALLCYAKRRNVAEEVLKLQE